MLFLFEGKGYSISMHHDRLSQLYFFQYYVCFFP